ncbi:MAG: amidohydrolase [Parvibaculales bacterium]
MMNKLRLPLTAIVAGLLLTGCDSRPPAAEADAIYLNGSVLTMTEPPEAEALAVKEGLILAVGDKASILRHKGANTKTFDLHGKTLMPGFFQTHAHFPFIAMKNQLVNIDPPPEGDVDSMDKLIAKLRPVAQATPAGLPVFAIGYDDTLLAEKRHPTKQDLDRISTEHPVFLIHISFHFVTMNSVALAKIGVDAQTQDPPGGVIRRIPGTQEPDGVFEEAAMMYLEGLLPTPTPQQLFDGYVKTMHDLAAKGYTTVVDHASTADVEKAYAALSDMGKMPLDLIAYHRLADPRQPAAEISRTYQGRYRTGGYKIVLDGSIQGFTGYLSQPYHSHTPHHDHDYRGYPHLNEEVFTNLVQRAYAENAPLLVHTNGDAATDLYIKAVRKASGTYPEADVRPVIIHAQTMREDQLDAAAELGMLPSFFVDHVYFWGDRHRDIFLGPDRAARISPAASALDRNMRFTLHDDAPVVSADPMRSAWAAVNRRTSSGSTLGPDQRIPAADALKALTLDAAYQQFEDTTKGSLEAGKRADMIILDENPLTMDPENIRSLKVLETIKDGETVFKISSGG